MVPEVGQDSLPEFHCSPNVEHTKCFMKMLLSGCTHDNRDWPRSVVNIKNSKLQILMSLLVCICHLSNHTIKQTSISIEPITSIYIFQNSKNETYSYILGNSSLKNSPVENYSFEKYLQILTEKVRLNENHFGK